MPENHGSVREISLSSCFCVGAALIHTCFNLIYQGYIPRGYPKWKPVGLYAFTADTHTEKISLFPSHELCNMEDVPSSLFFRSTFCSGVIKGPLIDEGPLCLISTKFCFLCLLLKGCLVFCSGICLLFLPAEAECL